MKYRPILFRPEMVRMILSGHKTMTRRIRFECYPGDRLWVRERHRFKQGKVIYMADQPELETIAKWRPSIFLSKWACRLMLEVVSTWPEHLHDISQEDFVAEGGDPSTDRRHFKDAWEEIHPGSWDENPLVDVISFRVIDLPEDWPPQGR